MRIIQDHHGSILAAAVIVAAAGMFGMSAQRADAQTTIYATVQNAADTFGTIDAVNISSPGVFTVAPITDTSSNPLSVPGGIDSLVFANPNTIIFTADTAGKVYKLSGFNQATNTYASETVLSTGLNLPQDIALEPASVSQAALTAAYGAGHANDGSVLVADMFNLTIDRVDITTGAVTYLGGGSGTNYGKAANGSVAGPEGLTYVPDAKSPFGYDLIATIGNRFEPVQRTIAQLDPITGVVSATNLATGLSYNDGLAYDPFSGKLFSSDRGNDAIYLNIDPTNLSGYTIQEASFVGLGGPGVGIEQPDGIAADGLGNIYDAGYDTIGTPGNIYEYVEGGGPPIVVANVLGLDDIAPMSGPGGPNSGSSPVPEPASMALLGLGAMGLLLRRRGKH